MVKHCILAQVFLKLAKQASGKTGLLLEVHVVKAPLVVEKWLQVLHKGWWKALELEPFGVGRLKSEVVASLAWIVSAVHIGVEENAKVCGELELIKCENVVAVGGGCVRVAQ